MKESTDSKEFVTSAQICHLQIPDRRPAGNAERDGPAAMALQMCRNQGAMGLRQRALARPLPLPRTVASRPGRGAARLSALPADVQAIETASGEQLSAAGRSVGERARRGSARRACRATWILVLHSLQQQRRRRRQAALGRAPAAWQRLWRPPPCPRSCCSRSPRAWRPPSSSYTCLRCWGSCPWAPTWSSGRCVAQGPGKGVPPRGGGARANLVSIGWCLQSGAAS